jgi:hypothetical protein
VPAIEKIGIKFHASTVLLGGASQIANGNIAAGVVKDFIGSRHLFVLAPQTMLTKK